MQQTVFDIWDVILSEMEDTCRGVQRSPIAALCSLDDLLDSKGSYIEVLETMAEYTGATTKFPPYNMTQMLRHSSARTPRQLSHRLEVP